MLRTRGMIGSIVLRRQGGEWCRVQYPCFYCCHVCEFLDIGSWGCDMCFNPSLDRLTDLAASRDLWKIQGMVPPMPKSDAELEWVRENRATEFEPAKGGL